MALTGDLLVATATSSSRQDTQGTTTSTTYTVTLTGGTSCGVAFIAPPSGQVIIHNKIYGYTGAAGFYGFIAPEVRTGGTIGSGTVVQGAADGFANVVANVVGARTVTQVLTGLTPGSTYNVRQMFRVDGNTGTFIYKELIVVPCV